MNEAFETYIATINDRQRPTFDRLHRLIVEEFPDVVVGISYDMPTFVVGDHRLYVGAWKNWVSIYGWGSDVAIGFLDRHPDLTTGKGTIQLKPAAARTIDDDEFRELIVAALGA